MELKPIKSSNLKGANHDSKTQELWVEFKGGGLYAYDGVPRELFDELMARDGNGVGGYFHDKIKDKFKFRRLK